MINVKYIFRSVLAAKNGAHYSEGVLLLYGESLGSRL